MAMLALAFVTAGCSTSDIAEDPYTSAPGWAPDYNAHYYYFPDMYTYYDAYTGRFIYYDGFRWIESPYLPPVHSHYDLYNSYIIVLNNNVHNPWNQHHYYSNTYPKGYYYGPRNMSHPNGVYPYRGYNENTQDHILPGEQPATNTPRPADRPRTTAPMQQQSKPGITNPRPQVTTPQQRQPNVTPAPQQRQRQPQVNPQPQKQMPVPKTVPNNNRPGAKRTK